MGYGVGVEAMVIGVGSKCSGTSLPEVTSFFNFDAFIFLAMSGVISTPRALDMLTQWIG